MSLLHLWALAIGAAALAAPLIVHWLTRPKPTRMPLSTVRFVLEVVEQRRARQRLRDWLILAMRMAAVALFAAAMARPLLGDRSLVSPEQADGDTLRVVVLDVSQSMAAETKGVRAFERGRALAAKHLAYRLGLRANLVLAAARPQATFDRASTNFASLRDELSRAAPRPERLHAQAALGRAAELLAEATGNVRRELVVISDFQRGNWAGVDFSTLPVDTLIELESVASAETPPNVAVERVGPRGRVEQGREFRLEVEVGNYAAASRKVDVEVTVGDSTFRLQGLCSPGTKSTLGTDMTLRQAGWQTGEARLLAVEDGLAADNTRPMAIDVRTPPTYLLLTRQAADARPSSSYFLERALVPAAPREGRRGETVVRADPARAETELLAAADLLVVDHAGKLPDAVIKLLATLMQRGKGVLYVASESIDATNLSLLAKAAGSGLQMPVEFVPPQAGQARRNLFLADVRRREEPFAVFGEEVLAAIGPLRFSPGLSSRRLEGGLADDVRATYNDQSAALVVTSSGAGTLAVLNVDLAASNLPASGVFVPLLGELAGHLLGQDRLTEATACGEPTAVFLPVSAGPAAGLRIVPPHERTSLVDATDLAAVGELVDEPLGVLWQVPAAGPPGVYRVEREEQTVYALPTAVPAEESDLASLDSELLTGRLSGGRKVQFRAAVRDESPRDDLWTWFAIACVGCIVGEVCGLRAFRT
jgi:hypothetical protein